jgi:hypothetical protein
VDRGIQARIQTQVRYCHVIDNVLDVGFGLVTGFGGHFQLSVHCGAVANPHTLQFATARNESSLSAVSSPLLWYRLPTTDVPLRLDSRTVHLSQPQQLFTQ